MRVMWHAPSNLGWIGIFSLWCFMVSNIGQPKDPKEHEHWWKKMNIDERVAMFLQITTHQVKNLCSKFCLCAGEKQLVNTLKCSKWNHSKFVELWNTQDPVGKFYQWEKEVVWGNSAIQEIFVGVNSRLTWPF